MERWERMKEIFELLNGIRLSVREITSIIEAHDDNVYLSLIDSLCRHYHKDGYLKRRKDPLNNYRYSYTLTKEGRNQLEGFLTNNQYRNYVKLIEI